jgi:hypothetical protein
MPVGYISLSVTSLCDFEARKLRVYNKAELDKRRVVSSTFSNSISYVSRPIYQARSLSLPGYSLILSRQLYNAGSIAMTTSGPAALLFRRHGAKLNEMGVRWSAIQPSKLSGHVYWDLVKQPSVSASKMALRYQQRLTSTLTSTPTYYYWRSSKVEILPRSRRKAWSSLRPITDSAISYRHLHLTQPRSILSSSLWNVNPSLRALEHQNTSSM